MSHWSDALSKLGACEEAREWAVTQPDLATAWATCERGDWMLWLLGRLSGPPESEGRKRLVLAVCDCAELALPYAGSERESAENCIFTTRAWAHGEATIEQVRQARRSAADAANAADATDAATYATYVTYAAATAAGATTAYRTAYAAANAADAAVDAYNAAANAADARKRSEVLRQCADIVRRHYPTAPVLP